MPNMNIIESLIHQYKCSIPRSPNAIWIAEALFNEYDVYSIYPVIKDPQGDWYTGAEIRDIGYGHVALKKGTSNAEKYELIPHFMANTFELQIDPAPDICAAGW